MQKTLQRISGLFCPQAFKNIQIDEIKIVLIKRTYRLAKTNLALLNESFSFNFNFFSPFDVWL